MCQAKRKLAMMRAFCYKTACGFHIIPSVQSHFSYVRPFATSWTVAHQAPLSMGFSRQEYWNGLSYPSPGDLPDPGIESAFHAFPALAGKFFTTVPPGKLPCYS